MMLVKIALGLVAGGLLGFGYHKLMCVVGMT